MQQACGSSTVRRVPAIEAGFTLIEVMITVAIVAILATIAFPAYSDYILRGRLVDATNALSNVRARMEQYYQDNRTYMTALPFTPPCLTPQTIGTFSVSCTGAGSVLTATQYTIVATGSGSTAGFSLTIDQDGTRASTVAAPAPWPAATYTCWVAKRGGC